MKNYKELYEKGKIVNGINGFQGEYESLSNFYILDKPIKINLPLYSENTKEYYFYNIESAFQSCKTLDTNEIDAIISHCKTAGQFKRYGRKLTLRKDWEDIKTKVMLDLLIKKCFCCTEFVDTLLSIQDDMYIVEMNYWNDKYWGVSTKDFYGYNMLGRLLMYIRRDLIDGRI